MKLTDSKNSKQPVRLNTLMGTGLKFSNFVDKYKDYHQEMIEKGFIKTMFGYLKKSELASYGLNPTGNIYLQDYISDEKDATRKTGEKYQSTNQITLNRLREIENEDNLPPIEAFIE